MAPRKIIIDTDPGVDDILAMLLAFAALPQELEVLLLSVTYGNVDVQNCLRNVVSMFAHIEKEIFWRRSQGHPPGFDALRAHKPLVAVGPDGPLADQKLMADYFHGRDGLGGIHESHPHMTPAESWKELFDQSKKSNDPAESELAAEIEKSAALFTPSKQPASEEILRLLRENEPDTITIVAIGPLTNLALAAASDAKTFLRAKEVVVMGGNINEHGNITPIAEFNTFADSVAAARVYALTSPQPASTMPPVPPVPPGKTEGAAPPPYLSAYPTGLDRQLNLALFPLDVTNYHLLARGQFNSATEELARSHSPLAEWTTAFLSATFNKIEQLQHKVSGDAVGLQLHDPLCIWYCMSADAEREGWKFNEYEDMRVETSGQWTRGMCVVDRRPRKKRPAGDDGERPGDTGNWLSEASGNRIRRCVRSPGEESFGKVLVERLFGVSLGG